MKTYYKWYYDVLLSEGYNDPFVDPMKGELAYSNIGHSIGDWLWAYNTSNDDFIKREVTGKETHFNQGLLYRYNFGGRYDKKRNAVSIFNLGYGVDTPGELIDRLKYEFGDSIRIKRFDE